MDKRIPLAPRRCSQSIHLSPTLTPPKRDKPTRGGACRRCWSKQETDCICLMKGEHDDHYEDKSDGATFHSNYIPQCFFIDGSRSKCCYFTFFNAGEVELFLLCNYFIIDIFYWLPVTLRGGFTGTLFFVFLKEGEINVVVPLGFLSVSPRRAGACKGRWRLHVEVWA